MHEVKLCEAVALSLNLNPDALPWDRFDGKFEAGAEFDSRLRITVSHASSSSLRVLAYTGTAHNSPVNLRVFAIWAAGIWKDLPIEIQAIAQAAAPIAPVTEIKAALGLPAPVVEATISRLSARRVDALAGLIEDAELTIGAGADVASISTTLFQWAIDDKKPGRLLPDTKGDVLRFTNGRHQEQITESALKQRIRRYLNRRDS